MKFKKLNEVDVIEEMSDSGHVLGVDEEGNVKRVPKGTMGKVKTVNGSEPDENGNVAIDIPEAECDWNVMKNKPFGEVIYSNQLIWNCDITGKEAVNYTYWVCDVELTEEDFKKGCLVQTYNNGVENFSADFKDMLSYGDDVLIAEPFAYAKFDGATTPGGIAYPKRGLYLYPSGDEFRLTLDESVKVFENGATKLDLKYLPDTIARIEDIPEAECDWNVMKNKPFGETGGIETIFRGTGSADNENNVTDSNGIGYVFRYLGDYVDPTGANKIILNGDELGLNVWGANDDGVITAEPDDWSTMLAFVPAPCNTFVSEANFNFNEAGVYIKDYNDNWETIEIIVDSTEVKTLDPKYLPEHLQFGEETKSITYDGTLDPEDGTPSLYRKVSDEIPDVARYDEVEVQTSAEGSLGFFELDWGINGGFDPNVPEVLKASDETTYVVIALEDNVQTEIQGALKTFPTRGVYFYQVANDYVDTYVSKLSWQGTKTLDEKYMPLLTSPNGTQYKLSVSDDGTLTATAV